MKKSLLLLAFTGLLCNLSAQSTISTADNPTGKPSHTIFIDQSKWVTEVADSTGGKIIITHDIFLPPANFINLPYIIGSSPKPVIDSTMPTPNTWWAFPLEKAKPKYRITNVKLVGWSVCAWGGLVDGVLEGYGFDGRRSFERKFGVDKYGYFGSRSWAKAYPDKNPQNPIKPASRVFGAWDFYHHADKMRKASYLAGGVVIGIGGAKTNQKWWHYAIDFGVSFAVSGATKAAGMYWIRN